MLRYTLFLILSILSQAAFAQFAEFVVKDKEGNSLRGAVLSKYNVIVAVSDSTGRLKMKDIGVVCRLHLSGYVDTSIVIRAAVKEIRLNRSNEQLMPVTLNYESPLKISLIRKDNSFVISPTDGTVNGDTNIEKVTKINVEAPSVLGMVMIPVVAHGGLEHDDWEFVVYSDDGGKPGNSVNSSKIIARYYSSIMCFNLFDYQIKLLPGTYYIGYKRPVGKFIQSKDGQYAYEATYIDKRASNGSPTFRKINDKDWEPVLMPKSTLKKLKYYSFGHMVQLVNHN